MDQATDYSHDLQGINAYASFFLHEPSNSLVKDRYYVQCQYIWYSNKLQFGSNFKRNL